MLRLSIVILSLAALVALSPTVGAESLYSLILDGKLEAARDSLQQLSTAALRDGDQLFYQALLASDADQAARLFSAALNAGVSPYYLEKIYYRLAQYHFMKGNYKHLGEHIQQYRARWENGRYTDQMLRYLSVVDEKEGAYESSIRQLDRYLTYFTDKEHRQWAELDKARVMNRYSKGIAAAELLRKLNKERSGPCVPPALYMLSMQAVGDGNTDMAIFYHSLLRESYPTAIGLDPLVDMISGVATYERIDTEAAKRTGTIYSIQVGAFSNKANARKMEARFRTVDFGTEIRSKDVAGQNYYVVYVGRFDSYEDAHAAKRSLESTHKEVFQVVAR